MPAVRSFAPSRPRLTRCVAAFFLSFGLAVGSTTPVTAAPTAAVAFNSVSAGPAILREAARHAGKSYRYGASGPSQFDCSGFTMYVFSRFGVRLPHNSAAQSRVAARVPHSERRPGDLIFFRSRGGRVTHVAIYAGGNTMWASPRTGKSVRLTSIYSARVSYGRVR